MEHIGKMGSFMLKNIFKFDIRINDKFISLHSISQDENQQQTNDACSEKWSKYKNTNKKNKFYNMQKEWYLKLYGFESEDDSSNFLKTKQYIFDAGCGLGHKVKWFADLSPKSIVIGIYFSDACKIAVNNYKNTNNQFFIKGDIAKTPFKDESIDYNKLRSGDNAYRIS